VAEKKAQETAYVVFRADSPGSESQTIIRFPGRRDGYWFASTALEAERAAAGDRPNGEYHACPARSWEGSANILEAEETVVVKVRRPEPLAAADVPSNDDGSHG
jgi:hypothetical protein